MGTVKRTYDASRRQQQARERRQRVVDVARQLMERDGYHATTIAGIAAAADVSAEMVYKSFGSKSALAKAVVDIALAGDDEPVPVRARPAADAVRAEPDVRRKIALFVAGLLERLDRSARMQIVVRDGRHGDPALKSVWDRLNDEGLVGMRMLAEHLHATGQLRQEVSLDEVTDVLWNYLAVDHYERLVLMRGWSTHRFQMWLTAAITAALCD